MNLSRVCVLAIAALFVLGAAQVASADQVSGTINLQASGWNANGSLTTSGTTSGTWTLTMDFVNTTGNMTDINSFAVQLFSASSTESFSLTGETVNGSSTITPWEFFADNKNTNGSSPDCKTNTVKGWVCGDTSASGTLMPFAVASGPTPTEFILSGTFSAPGGLVSSLDLLASGCLVQGSCMLDGGSKDTNKWAVSGTMGGTTNNVPEPSSLMLLGAGLLALGSLAGRRLLTA